jgi:hypothetical protein
MRVAKFTVPRRSVQTCTFAPFTRSENVVFA